MKTEIKLKDLMSLERLLLEIDVKYKFELSFKDALKLYEYLKEVGKITNYFFLIQDEFHKKYNDIDKLKEYHNKIMVDEVEFDYKEIVDFIDNILASYGDEEFQKLLSTVKFW